MIPIAGHKGPCIAGDPRSVNRERRRGTVLVQVALFLTVWAALAALTLDLARVRAARESMQNALDHAAIEGLRTRDSLTEAERRATAARAVRLAFDADLVEGSPDSGPPLGAGAVIEVAERDGVPGAGGFDPDTLALWRPTPELNVSNAAHGDFVAGQFVPGLGSTPESTGYGRADFVPVDAAASSSATAFLARLRRTRPDQPLDRIPGVSSAGPTISLLFGFGTTIQPDPASGFDVKRDGLTVRATSIASARRALGVSTAPLGQGLLEIGRDSGPGGSGLALIPAIDFAVWQALAEGASLAFDANGTGQVVSPVDGGEIGRIWGTLDALVVGDAVELAELPQPAALGIAFDPLDAGASAASVRAIAVQRTTAGGALEIVGFVAARVSVTSGPTWSIEKLGSRIGADRATVHVPAAWLALEPGGPLERPDLVADHFALDGVLLAPVLSR